MKKNTLILVILLLGSYGLSAQQEPTAGTWATWLIPSGKAYLLPPPPPKTNEITLVLDRQRNLDSATLAQITYWNMGAPNYHWQQMMRDVWMSDARGNGILANMLLGVATYDAMIAAWDSKYTYNRARPFLANNKIHTLGIKPESPSYPCEYAVAAGVATTIIGHFFPDLADSVKWMAEQEMDARVAAGMAYPSDTRAGFELGQKIANKEIEATKGYFVNTPWDGKIPDEPGLWRGKFAMLPHAGQSKTIALHKGDQFRPGPAPDFAKDMAELKNYKQSMSSMGNALQFATQSVWEEMLDQKIFEYNLQQNPPLAARMYALAAIGTYDGFVACWDAKYAYWGIRPDQYDTTFQPLLKSPPFPGYPSGHAAIGSVLANLYAYFFPAEKAFFEERAKAGAESRFQAGIHFRTDNDVALELGRKVAGAVIQKAKMDGADRAEENRWQRIRGTLAKPKPIKNQ